MTATIRLLILADDDRLCEYGTLLDALPLSPALLERVEDAAAANAVLLGRGAPVDMYSGSVLNLPCLAESEQLSHLQPAQCLAELQSPLYDSLLEGLSRLSTQLLGEASGSADHGLVAHSPAMQSLCRQLMQVADKSVTVLINGPSGAGKELVAQAIHRLSGRCAGPFVPINCGAIPRELLESELFGHERGAFTGAISSRAGRFEMADGGTLFLDEIGDMPLDMQVKILRAIQERSFERVGSSQSRSADVRIVAATHRDLPAMISAGQFREDLYYRLNVFPLQVPALAERREDIPALLRSIAQQLADEGLGQLCLAPSAIASLQAHPWAGNVRELANLLERLLILFPAKVVGVQDLPEAYQHGDVSWQVQPVAEAEHSLADWPEQGVVLKTEVMAHEQMRIRQALAAADNVVSRAAELLSLRRTTLIEKMRKYAISTDF